MSNQYRISPETFRQLAIYLRTIPNVTMKKLTDYTTKYSFPSGFACAVSSNKKNDSLAVHFEKPEQDPENHWTIEKMLGKNFDVGEDAYS